MTFPKEVWTTLNEFDCSAMVEKKGQLNYLSWANAWTSLMSVYPDSSFAFLDDVRLPNGTVEVHVSVTVADGEHQLTRKMPLPVMNYKNIAIVDPDARDVSDARMRCLVKCIALFGLGLFLYRGEDIPVKRKEEPEIVPCSDDTYAAINTAIKAGELPKRTTSWLQAGNNWQNLTEKQGQNVLAHRESK